MFLLLADHIGLPPGAWISLNFGVQGPWRRIP